MRGVGGDVLLCVVRCSRASQSLSGVHMFAKRTVKKAKTRKGPLSEGAEAASAIQEGQSNDTLAPSRSGKQDNQGESTLPERVERVRIVNRRRTMANAKHFIQAVGERRAQVNGLPRRGSPRELRGMGA